MNIRPYDAVIFGSTTLAFESLRYFVSDVESKMGIAMCAAAAEIPKLTSARERVASMTACEKLQARILQIPIIPISSADDVAGYHTMANQCRVVIACQRDEHVVAACCRASTDYVDACTDLAWISRVREANREVTGMPLNRARLVSGLVFEAATSDVGVLLATRAAQNGAKNNNCDADSTNTASATVYYSSPTLMARSETITAVHDAWHPCQFDASHVKQFRMVMSELVAFARHKIQSYLRFGTVATPSPEWTEVRVPACGHDPSVFMNKDAKVAASTTKRFTRAEWTNFLPQRDPTNSSHLWSGPTLMAPLSAKIVFASSQALKYSVGEDNGFKYSERVLPLGFRLTGMIRELSLIPAMMAAMWAFVVFLFASIAPVWRLIERVSGTGLGKFLLDSHQIWFRRFRNDKVRVDVASSFVVTRKNVDDNLNELDIIKKKTNYTVKSRVDIEIPASESDGTVVCLCEAALALLAHRERLPERPAQGFGTPATVLGTALALNLKENANWTIKTNVDVIPVM